MKYKTEDFTSPTGSKVLFATYDDESKLVAFHHAEDYFYTSDSASMNYTAMAEQFIKEQGKTINTVEDANTYLNELGIDAHFVSEA